MTQLSMIIKKFPSVRLVTVILQNIKTKKERRDI